MRISLLNRLKEAIADRFPAAQYPNLRPAQGYGRKWRNRGDPVTLILPARIIVLVLSLAAILFGSVFVAIGGFSLYIIGRSLFA